MDLFKEFVASKKKYPFKDILHKLNHVQPCEEVLIYANTYPIEKHIGFYRLTINNKIVESTNIDKLEYILWFDYVKSDIEMERYKKEIRVRWSLLG